MTTLNKRVPLPMQDYITPQYSTIYLKIISKKTLYTKIFSNLCIEYLYIYKTEIALEKL